MRFTRIAATSSLLFLALPSWANGGGGASGNYFPMELLIAQTHQGDTLRLRLTLMLEDPDAKERILARGPEVKSAVLDTIWRLETAQLARPGEVADQVLASIQGAIGGRAQGQTRALLQEYVYQTN